MKTDSSYHVVTTSALIFWLCLFASNTHAFVPVSTAQSRTNRMIGTVTGEMASPNLSVAIVPDGSHRRRHHRHYHHTQNPSTTSLYMAAGIGGGGGNLVDRFSRVLRGTLNKAVASVEDPEKIILQAVDDMQVRRCAMGMNIRMRSSRFFASFFVCVCVSVYTNTHASGLVFVPFHADRFGQGTDGLR